MARCGWSVDKHEEELFIVTDRAQARVNPRGVHVHSAAMTLIGAVITGPRGVHVHSAAMPLIGAAITKPRPLC